jgi:hypothetical protein
MEHGTTKWQIGKELKEWGKKWKDQMRGKFERRDCVFSNEPEYTLQYRK